MASPRGPGTALKVSWGSETKGVKAGPVAPPTLSCPYPIVGLRTLRMPRGM